MLSGATKHRRIPRAERLWSSCASDPLEVRPMRIGAITVVAALAAVSSATAQTPTQASPSNVELVAQYATDKLKSELDLTSDQIPKVQKINVATAGEMKKLVDKYGADTSLASDRALSRGIVTAIRSNQTQLKSVLTPAQWTLHQQHKSERLAQAQTELMTYELGLSRSQILDVQQINQDGANKLVAALDKPLAGGKPTHAALLEAARPAMASRDSALEKVLTVDQFKKVQSSRRALQELFVSQASASPTPAPAAAAPKPKP
jgi:hypothetical protein